jgi:lipopolysaccharide assembly protein A
MRVLCFLFLLAFAGAVAAFAWQNQHDVTVAFHWGFTGSLALVVGAAFLLGMLSGWSVVGLLRRSFGRASELLEERRPARSGW